MSLLAAMLMCLSEPSTLPPEQPSSLRTVLSLAVSAEANPQETSGNNTVAGYAERERIASPDLETFRGGSSGVVVLIVVVVAVLVLLAILIPW